MVSLWDIWVQFVLGVCLYSSDLHGSSWCLCSSPFHALFVSFLQLHIHKVSITLLIFLFRILFLCSLPNSAHFLSICMFCSKPMDIGKRKSKITNQFCLFKNWIEPSFLSRNNSISYNLTHFATIKISKKMHFCLIFHWTNIDSWLSVEKKRGYYAF